MAVPCRPLSNVPPARVESNNKVSGKQARANGLRTHAHRLLDTRLPCAADLAVRHEVVRLQQQDGRLEVQVNQLLKSQGKDEGIFFQR